MEEKRVSIIVPVYNVEKYINACVDSLVNQTYKNLEIILVDDGSTDNSGSICDDYAKKDSRVKVIHKENGGASSSRKMGIESSTGDYIVTLDSDDWIDLETVEVCINKTEEYVDTDCVMFSYKREYDTKSFETHIFDGDKVFIGADAEDLVYRRLFGLIGDELASPEKADSVVPCCMKLYKREFALKGKYVNVKLIGSADDTIFNMYALHGAKKIVYVDKCFYHYRKQGGTVTTTYRPNLVEQWNNLFNMMGEIIKEKNLPQKYEKALSNRIALSIVGIGTNEFCAIDKSFHKKVKSIKNYLKSERYKNAIQKIETKNMPLKWKVFMFFAKHKNAFMISIMIKLILKLKSKKER